MMRKAHAAALLLLLLLSGAAPASGLQQPAEWEKFNSPEGRFQILMPAKPEAEVKEVDSVVGKLTLHAFSASSVTGYFLVSYGDYPTEPKDAEQAERVLDSVKTGVVKGLEAEVLSEKKITLGERPGREFTARKMNNGVELNFTWRIYLDGRRLYQMAAVTQAKDSKSPEVEKFLASFNVNKQVQPGDD